jgi:hypothetical protein
LQKPFNLQELTGLVDELLLKKSTKDNPSRAVNR